MKPFSLYQNWDRFLGKRPHRTAAPSSEDQIPVAKFVRLLVLVVKQFTFLALHPLVNVMPSPRKTHTDNRDTERQHPKSQDWQKTENSANEQQCCQQHTGENAQRAAPA